MIENRSIDSSAPHQVIRDTFDEAACLFLRASEPYSHHFPGATSIHGLAAGGWIIEGNQQAYWLPQPPIARRLDTDGRILDEEELPIAEFALDEDGLRLGLLPTANRVVDLVVWELTSALRTELTDLFPMETQDYFLLGSHTRYTKPADIYLHLISGWIYENRKTWPKYRKICSENDAHALYMLLSGLERATGKNLYRHFKKQIVISVISRQAEDGGWYHGEWTDGMESHFRLCASATHLLMDAQVEFEDPAVHAALERATRFLAEQHDRLSAGIWFLHDSLEKSEEGMRQSPFTWLRSRAFGKSVSDMLVLNTHLDITIALHRYYLLGGTNRSDLVNKAHAATRMALGQRPAEWLYRQIFRILDLTSLPSDQAARLPLPLRALKRLGWKYIAPNLHHVKTRWPRFVMPGGYIDRSICLKGWAFHYLTINIMDILRYGRMMATSEFMPIAREAIRFTQESGIRQRWKELRYEKYALGFWAEALYLLCMAEGDSRHRALLAEAILDLEEMAMGISPSLLGANREIADDIESRPAIMPWHESIRIVPLHHPEASEYLLVNTGDQEISFPCPEELCDATWKNSEDSTCPPDQLTIQPRSWLRAALTI